MIFKHLANKSNGSENKQLERRRREEKKKRGEQVERYTITKVDLQLGERTFEI